MTPDQIVAVTDSFANVVPIARQAGLSFYARLFEIDPSVRPLFADDLDEQAKKLMQLLGFAVANLSYPDELLPAIRKLGARHAGYGVKDAHYDSVAQALLATLSAALGPDWTPHLEQSWVAAYTIVATEMKEAQHRVVVTA